MEFFPRTVMCLMLMFNLIFTVKKCLKTNNVFLFRAIDVIIVLEQNELN